METLIEREINKLLDALEKNHGVTKEFMRAEVQRWLMKANLPLPIPMVLHCPHCGLQHVDAADPAAGWTNPTHRSHKCHGCGVIWRAADVPTVGVASTATRGTADTWPFDAQPDDLPAIKVDDSLPPDALILMPVNGTADQVVTTRLANPDRSKFCAICKVWTDHNMMDCEFDEE